MSGRAVAGESKEAATNGKRPGAAGEVDFALLIAQGSFLTGFNILRVSAGGRAEYQYDVDDPRVEKLADRPGVPTEEETVCHHRKWRKAEFQLDEPARRQLREDLNASGVMWLLDTYAARGVCDGTQWVIRI